MILTREEFVEIADELTCDKVSGVKVQQLLDHDAALRELVARLEQEREEYKRKYDLVRFDDDYRRCCELRDQAEQQLIAQAARIAELEHEVAKAHQIIADLVPLAPPTRSPRQISDEIVKTIMACAEPPHEQEEDAMLRSAKAILEGHRRAASDAE